MVYHRFKFNGMFLKKEDFKYGYGFDTDHYLNIVRKRRELRESNILNKHGEKYLIPEDFKESYDRRSGYYIDGTKIETKFHPLHNYSLLDTGTNSVYIIDSVNIQYHVGKILSISMRKINTRSHGIRYYMNYSSHDPEVIETIKKNQKRYKLIDEVTDEYSEYHFSDKQKKIKTL
jgi:hypothetical protein